MGIKESAFGQYDTQQLKAELNKILKGLNHKEGKICSVTAQKDGYTLIEVDSDATASWFANHVNRVEFCTMLGDEVAFKPRAYNVIALNVPLNLDTTNEKHREEINEANGWDRNTITAFRWAKPPERRSAHQRSAHLVLSFVNPESANRAIASGLMICNKKCQAERVRKEPIRCLRCQGWNHMAKDCAEPHDRCSNCTDNHRSAVCMYPDITKCVSCKSNTHASWSRECPTFLRKVEEFNERNPENILTFFPTTEPWTWATGPTNATVNKSRYSTHKDSRDTRKGKSKEPARRCDSYNPSYNNDWLGNNEDTSPPLHRWWDDDPQTNQAQRVSQLAGPSGSSSRPPHPSSQFVFVNNNRVAGPSNWSHAILEMTEGLFFHILSRTHLPCSHGFPLVTLPSPSHFLIVKHHFDPTIKFQFTVSS